MRRKITIGILCILASLLQTTLLSYIEVASIRPNFPLILTVSFALMCGRLTGTTVGFISGILLDLFGGGVLGYYALLYMLTGYAAGSAYRIFYDDDIKTPLLLVTAGDLFYSFSMYTLTFLLRGRIHFWFYLRRIIIPELLYTIIATLVLYHFLYRINQSLNKSDKRSLDYFA